MERFQPHLGLHIWYEHWHRYHFCLPIIDGLRVLDIACGEGYGSSLISTRASHVIGIDIDTDTITHAKQKYNQSNLEFRQGDVREIPLPDHSVDAIVSFETLEHIEEHQQMLSEFKRVLSKDGLLILSTPDKDVYSEEEHHNHYHLKELSLGEFNELLQVNFKHNRLFGQSFQTLSVISEITAGTTHSSKMTYANQAKGESQNASVTANYLIMVSSQSESALQQIGDTVWHGFNDDINSPLRALC